MRRVNWIVAALLSVGAGCSPHLLSQKPADADFEAATCEKGTSIDSITVTLSESATMDFVYIAPGTFTMGSPSSEAGRFDREGPQLEVTISKGFYLGKYEVTQRQWKAVMGNNPSYFSGDDKPVEQVSWYDVHDFIHRLNVAARDSLFRLPTEAEWEYACRAGTTTRWFFGDDESQLKNYAVYESNNRGLFPRYGTRNAGMKMPNPWGLYDMYGNVIEWCQDWYRDYPIEAQTDPAGPLTGTGRVLRGGNWGDIALHVRSADRGGMAPDVRNLGIGFRLLVLTK